MEGVLQIPPAVAEVAVAGDVGEADQPYSTAWQAIADAAPYLGQQRELTRLTIGYVLRFTPVPLGSTAVAPEELTVSFELLSGGQVVFSEPQTLRRAVFLEGVGIGFYPGQVNTDFRNPLTLEAGGRLEWRFSGVIPRQAGVVEALEEVSEPSESQTVPDGNGAIFGGGMLVGSLGPEELSAELEALFALELPSMTTTSTVNRQVTRQTPYQREGRPSLFFAIGYELEREG